MTTTELSGQYATGLSRRNIEKALADAGLDQHRLKPADLGMLEDFHTLGRLATSQLAELAEIGAEDVVLDAGTGIGGTARFLADRYGCRVTGVDLTEEYCATARWLNALVGLDGLISIRQAGQAGTAGQEPCQRQPPGGSEYRLDGGRSRWTWTWWPWATSRGVG